MCRQQQITVCPTTHATDSAQPPAIPAAASAQHRQYPTTHNFGDNLLGPVAAISRQPPRPCAPARRRDIPDGRHHIEHQPQALSAWTLANVRQTTSGIPSPSPITCGLTATLPPIHLVRVKHAPPRTHRPPSSQLALPDLPEDKGQFLMRGPGARINTLLEAPPAGVAG